MGKLPAFQFYPGDWLKDPPLRRCSAAARGVWIDMLCLMFECEERGVLASYGEAWSDRDIAASISGDTSANLACIQELLRKGVASRNAAGAIYSRRMIRDEQIRKQVAVRVKKHRRNGHVTRIETEKPKLPEDEVEAESEIEVGVAFDLEEFDHEKAVREIQQAHPRPENSQANEIAILEALEYVVKQRQCRRQEAAEWLLARTEMYRLATENWAEKQFVTKSTRWFTSRGFEEDSKFWERTNGNGRANTASLGTKQAGYTEDDDECDRATLVFLQGTSGARGPDPGPKKGTA